jgi:hypothetical protein
MPRLVAVLDRDPAATSLLLLGELRVPEGMSVLWVPLLPGSDTVSEASFVKELLYGIIHDYPLHEVTKSSVRLAGASLNGPPVLIADPASVEDLRMTDALAAVVDEAMALEAKIDPGDVDRFLSRAGPLAPPTLAPLLRGAASLAQPIKDALTITAATNLDVIFA